MASNRLSKRPPVLIVTGCARSGTGFMSQVLNKVGIECGHEALIGPTTEGIRLHHRLIADSSWLAAPFVSSCSADTLVLHQIRHPVKVVRSLMSTGFFGDGDIQQAGSLAIKNAKRRGKSLHALLRSLPQPEKRTRLDYQAFVRRHCPEIYGQTLELDRCIQYWISWNRMIEEQAAAGPTRYTRYQLEKLDANLLVKLLAPLKGNVNTKQAAEALAAVRNNYNTRPTLTNVTGTELLNSSLNSELYKQSLRFGYQIDPHEST